jgi:hypothetical protein
MTDTIATIAEKALRLLGVAVVPIADRPPLNTATTQAAIATNALIELGVIVTSQVPPSQATVVSEATIATNALTKLAVIASDETPNAADQALAVAAVDAVHNSLVAQGIADWTSAAITTAVSEEYAMLTVAHIATAFGKAADLQTVAAMEGRIATISRVLRAQALALSKVAEVQASLNAQGLVSWDNTGVPTGLGEEYTQLTVQALASSFGKQGDPKMVAMMEDRVRRFAMILRSITVATEAAQAVHDELVGRGLARWSVFDIPDMVSDSYVTLAADKIAPAFDKQTDPNDSLRALRTIAQVIALPTSGEPVAATFF